MSNGAISLVIYQAWSHKGCFWICDNKCVVHKVQFLGKGIWDMSNQYGDFWKALRLRLNVLLSSEKHEAAISNPNLKLLVIRTYDCFILDAELSMNVCAAYTF